MKNIKFNERLTRFFFSIITIAILGELYVYPLNESFRFTSGVIAFGLIVLLLDINEIALSLWTAALTLILRGFIYYLVQDSTLIEGINANLPSSLYYVLYGHLAYFFSLRNNRSNLLQTYISLFAIDFISNLVEALVRNNLTFYLFKTIIIAALFRSILIYGIYTLIKKQENIIKVREVEKRYLQLNNLVSNIQAEMFYLKKSTHDIEKVMSRSFELYESNKDNLKVSKDSLFIAREIHEIKKDYNRVLKGFESFLEDFEDNDRMSFKDIIFIIQSNYKRYMDRNKKDIQLYVTVDDNLYISKYYSIFTLLNNLITNAIDAIDETGYIKIHQNIENDFFVVNVINNGEPINVDLFPLLFNPGFTTKYDEVTGNSSTGIGLSHVKNIVDELKGNIEVVSKDYTKFTISIPLESLRG